MTKCTLQVIHGHQAHEHESQQAEHLGLGRSPRCTAAISPTITGMVTMLRISIIGNHGSPMGASGDGNDSNPAVSGIAYRTLSSTVPPAETIPSLRALAVNVDGTSLPCLDVFGVM